MATKVKNSKTSQRPRLIAIVFAIIAIIVIGVWALKSRASNGSEYPQYKTAKVTVDTVKKTVSATGTLQAWTTVDIKSKAGGQILNMLVDVGSVVKKGQVLAKIDPNDSQLAVNTALADTNGAEAHTEEAASTYGLQLQQTAISIDTAKAQLAAAQANANDDAAKLQASIALSGAEPQQSAAEIGAANANYDQAAKELAALGTTNLQDKASAQAAYDEAVANQTSAKVTVDRQVTLAQQGFVPQQTVDTDQAAYQVAVAQTNTAQEKLQTVGAEQQADIAADQAKVAQTKAAVATAVADRVNISTAVSAVAQARATYQQAVAQVAQSQAALQQAIDDVANNTIKKEDIGANQATVQANKAELVDAQQTLNQTIVRSPVDGVVLVKYVDQGTIIPSGLSTTTTGTAIINIGDLSRMYVQAVVDETDIASVDTGQNVDVSFDAYPDIPFSGKVVRVDPLAVVTDNVTSFDVRVEIDNSDPTFRLLKPGMNATCNFVVDKKDDVVNVPEEAVQTDDSGNNYVLVASGGHQAPTDPVTGITPDPGTLVDAKVSRRSVTIGLEGDDNTEITAGLKEGDTVVTQTVQAPVATTSSTTTSSPFASSSRGPGGGGGGRGR